MPYPSSCGDRQELFDHNKKEPPPVHKSLESAEEKKLSERLYNAIMALRQVLPAEIVELLTSDQKCVTNSDVWQWRDCVAEAILDKATPRSDREMGYTSLPRAYCPLCGGSSQSPLERGFAFPAGLKKHLCGDGNAHECCVLKVFREHALDQIADEFVMRMRTAPSVNKEPSGIRRKVKVRRSP
jgi:hypothetical protein